MLCHIGYIILRCVMLCHIGYIILRCVMLYIGYIILRCVMLCHIGYIILRCVMLCHVTLCYDIVLVHTSQSPDPEPRISLSASPLLLPQPRNRRVHLWMDIIRRGLDETEGQAKIMGETQHV